MASAATTLRLLDEIAASAVASFTAVGTGATQHGDAGSEIPARAMLEALVSTDFDLAAAIVRLHRDA